LLAFSRKQVLRPRLLDLNQLVADTDGLLRRLIGEDIDLATVLAPDLGAVCADSGGIEQALMNLAVNARDAMPDGGKLPRATAKVEVESPPEDGRPARYVMVAVSDPGHGMDEHVRSHLFEPFFTTKEVGKGTGLGLATVHGIVEQSGGHLRVIS